jgi:hypothetical protein
MPLELQIIRAQEFIRLGPRGRFDLKASKAALAHLAAACCRRGTHQALLDLRALQPLPTPVFSPRDLSSLVKTFREIGFTRQQRLAVLYHSDPHQRARMFASIATLRGWQVQAFEDFETAVGWLSASSGENRVPQNALEIPVRSATSLKTPARSGSKTPVANTEIPSPPTPMPRKTRFASPSRVTL